MAKKSTSQSQIDAARHALYDHELEKFRSRRRYVKADSKKHRSKKDRKQAKETLKMSSHKYAGSNFVANQ